jgi:glutathione S-transferase
MRVVWALEETGASYEPVAVKGEERDQAAHRARHPLGRVPALEDDDGNVMFESTALVMHVGDLYPDSALMPPAGSVERAQVCQWAIAAMTELEGPLVQFLINLRGGNPELAEPGAQKFAENAPAFEQALQGREFLVGDSLTAADVVLGGVLLLAALAGKIGDYPALSAYLERMKARPGFQKSLADTESLLREVGAPA